MHWNPHWQCFVSADCQRCGVESKNYLKEYLSTVGPDFVNLVEFEASLDLDSRWGLIGEGNATCGDDWDTLVYDKTRWTKIDDEVGCLYEGRSFAMARFSHKEVSNLTMHVVGAHFPQTLTDQEAYESAISVLRSKLTPGERLIFLADTNTEGPDAAASVPSHHGWNRTNTQMLEDLLGEKEEPRAAPLFPGCCQNDGYQWQGDRAMANFGAVSSSHVLFEDPPTWANCSGSEFHKGVSLVIEA